MSEHLVEVRDGAEAVATGLGLLAALKRFFKRPSPPPGPTHGDILNAINGMRTEIGTFKEDVREQFRQVHERLLTQERREIRS